ncbi:MAG: acyl--CoA ligase family protein [Ignavibacteriales bacterium]
MIHIRPLTPLDFLERSAFIFRDKIAVVDGTTRRTYPQFRERVHRYARALLGFGLAPGDRVAILCTNSSPLLEAHFAVPLAGGVLCAINTRLKADEIAYIVGHCGARIFIYDSDFARLAEEVRQLLQTDGGSQPIFVRIGEGRADDPEFEELLTAQSGEPLEHSIVDEDTTISINYTSGTTGRPKGVMYTHRGAYLNALAEIFHANLLPESLYLWTVPMFHCNGWIFPWAVTAAGGTHVCLRKLDPGRVLQLIEEERVTHFCAAPTVLISIANHPNAKPFSHPVHITTAGAPPSPTIIAQMERLGAHITHVYGLTEVYGPISICQWQSPQWDQFDGNERARLKSRQGVSMITVGASDIRVVDERLNDVPKDGETPGEIVMCGNNVMKGYYNDPVGTENAFTGGWFHSGDIAVWHPDGYIEICDRSKDIIISGGENISSIQVEKVIIAHPAVMECAVVAIPHDYWGEVPKAFVTLKPGYNTAEEEIIAFCHERLPGFKTPKAVEFCDLPKTSTGKIQKFVLREREWTGRAKRVN